MTRPIELVLQRAEGHGVQASGRGRWRMVGACHGAKRTRSVAISEGDRGAVLLKCFAGCEVEAVAQALGLELQDLFPARPGTAAGGAQGQARPFSAAALAKSLGAELNVAWVLLADVEAGRPMSADDRRRAGLARERCLALIEELRLVS